MLCNLPSKPNPILICCPKSPNWPQTWIRAKQISISKLRWGINPREKENRIFTPTPNRRIGRSTGVLPFSYDKESKRKIKGRTHSKVSFRALTPKESRNVYWSSIFPCRPSYSISLPRFPFRCRTWKPNRRWGWRRWMLEVMCATLDVRSVLGQM